MKVLLLKDVYKLGRAGDIKKVAGGFGRNYLIPQGLAILATPGSTKNAGRIQTEANKNREILNKELGGLAAQLNGHQLAFPVRASETGKLFGSIATRTIAAALNETFESELSHRQIETQPLRSLGVYEVSVRLTIDLAAEIQVVVHREGESIESAFEFEEEKVAAEELAEEMADEVDDEVEADEAEADEVEAVDTDETEEEEEEEEGDEDEDDEE